MRRLKVGEALERWVSGQGEGLAGRVTFQLEEVYTTKRGKRYGPYGPYWYVYWHTPLGHLRRSNVTRQRSRYVGKPDAVDPATMTAEHLRALIMPTQEELTGIGTLGIPKWKIAAGADLAARKKKRKRKS